MTQSPPPSHDATTTTNTAATDTAAVEAPSLETVADTPVGHNGAQVTVTEKSAWNPGAGAAVLAIVASIVLILGGFVVITLPVASDAATIACIVIGALITVAGFVVLTMPRILSPGHTFVVQFFGHYLGTARRTGLSIVPPLASTKKVSVRVRNFETNEIKVNDLGGNPVNIGAIIVWQVADTALATFSVEDAEEFIHTQAESALRHVTTSHPYDGGPNNNPSLSGSTDLISQELAEQVAERVRIAGLEILEARISNLAYAPEIAQSMLQRQQAAAVVDARETIVDGAVSMVESALDKLEEKEIVDLDPERRAAMVSNLLVVLCADSSPQPMINTGSLYT